jgi:4'-phosphopantetheinyl transferase
MVHPVHIYHTDTRHLSQESALLFLDGLPLHLQQRIRTITHHQARTASLAALMLTEKLLTAEHGGCTLARLQYSSLGKPLIDDRFAISIAHSGSVVVVAGSFAPYIGIDIEQVANPDVSLYQEYFSVADYKQIITSATPGETLLSLWTRKEAILKAAGVGMPGLDNTLSVSDSLVRFQNNNYYLSDIQLVPGYIAALALSAPGDSCQVTPISFS